MIHSAATRYAIRAVCHLAQVPAGERLQARDIAGALDIPRPFLAKILQELAKKGLLSSSKGPGGGFCLNCPPAETSLYALVEAVEGPIRDDECLLGLELCGDDSMCPMHDFWKQMRQAFRERLMAISLADVVAAGERKRRLAQLGGRQVEASPG